MFILLLCFFAAGILHAQSVALVLSGGGAKGLAHIGVIQALEENNIPIDYITGTSMGAIVGGMYASGMSVEEMKNHFHSEEFATWLTGEIEEEYQFYYKKEDPDAEWINAKFDLDSVISANIVPTNIISPYQMDFAFLQYFAQPSAACTYDFDKLMIPFRCVTSDIESNRAYVCRSGDLGAAIRASMSFPFYFKPITINGKVMMDGGMYNNFPLDVAIDDFNPDVVIGSVVAGNYGKPSTDDMVSMLQSIFMSNTDYSIPDTLGFLLRPDVRFLELLDFSQIDAIIDSGYLVTKRNMEVIKDRISREVTPSEVSLNRGIFKNNFPPLLFQNINPIGLRSRQAEYVSLLLKQEADVLTLSQLKPNYFRMIADDKIASVYPRARYNPGTGYFDIFLDVEPAKDFTISFGGNITSSSATQAFLGFRYKLLNSYSWTFSGNAYVGNFYNSFLLKARLEYPSDPPFYAEFIGTINDWDYNTTSRYFVGDASPSFLIKHDNYLRFTFGVPVSTTTKMAIDLVATDLSDSYYHTNAFTRQDTSDNTEFTNFSFGMFLEKNTLNQKAFATEGEEYLISLRYVSGMEDYTPGSTSLYSEPINDRHRWLQMHLEYEKYFMPMGALTVGVYGEAMISNRDLLGNFMASKIQAPGFNPVPYSEMLFIPEYRAYNWFGAGMCFNYNIWNPLDIRADVFTFNPYQEIIEIEDQIGALGERVQAHYLGGSVALVFNNPILPASLSLAYYGGTEQPLQVLFNLGYVIFNKPSHF